MCGTLLHLVWLYLFVIYFKMEVIGLGLATLLTNLGLVVMIQIYAW